VRPLRCRATRPAAADASQALAALYARLRDGRAVRASAASRSYCTVDFWCYYFGLWVIQRYGASMMVIASTIALPLSQLVLCLRPLVGKWAEAFFWGDGVALGLVLAGFTLYQAFSREGRAERGEG
jgi:hypothetical protein